MRDKRASSSCEVGVVVDQRRKQIVRGGDRVDVASEMQIDVGHGQQLRVAATRCAALEPERGAQRGLSQTQCVPQAQATEGLSETDRGHRLAGAFARGRDGRDQDQLAARRLR